MNKPEQYFLVIDPNTSTIKAELFNHEIKLTAYTIFYQSNIKLTETIFNTYNSDSEAFSKDLLPFGGVSRVAQVLKDSNGGAVRFHPIKFQTMHFRVKTLQKYGINNFPVNMSEYIATAILIAEKDSVVKVKVRYIRDNASCSIVPKSKIAKQARIGFAVDNCVYS